MSSFLKGNEESEENPPELIVKVTETPSGRTLAEAELEELKAGGGSALEGGGTVQRMGAAGHEGPQAGQRPAPLREVMSWQAA